MFDFYVATLGTFKCLFLRDLGKVKQGLSKTSHHKEQE